MTSETTRAIEISAEGAGSLAPATLAGGEGGSRRCAPARPGGPPAMTAAPLDLVIKNVRVVRPRQPAVEVLDLGVRDGRFARIAPGIPAGDARAVFDGRRPPRLPGRRGRPHARGHLRAAVRRRGEREQGGGRRRRDRHADLLPHRPVLPEPRRPVRRVLPGGAPALGRPLLGRLRVPPRPDPGLARGRDGGAGRRARRAVVQDLHVLRGLRPPREGGPPGPAELPHARRGRALRPRPLRVRHARGGGRPGAPPRAPPTTSA